jgi:hypothetical protein
MKENVRRIKDHLDHQDVKSVRQVPSELKMGNPPTKKKADNSALTESLRTGNWRR